MAQRAAVNITYGVLNAPDGFANTSTSLSAQGTDLIVTYGDGQVVAYSPGDIAWILTCTALVWLMIPGLGYLYAGLTRRKNALHMLLMTMMALAVISIQFFFWGFSLAFNAQGGAFLGNLHQFGFINVLQQPAANTYNKIPEIVYAMYQMMFASLVPAIAIGAACERARVWPFIIFTFVWATLVYDPIASWVWNAPGWAYKWGVLDYAGGGPVEICSGITGTVISYYLGKRRGYGTDRLLFKPNNVSYIVLGTALLWFGWLGFNGGSTFAANLRAAMSIATTNTAAATAGLTWMLLDYRLERKWSVVGFCTGAIAGLVAITPAAGFINVPASLAVGFLAAVASNFATQLKVFMRCDDVMDVFAVHALAGWVGLLLTGLFAQKEVAANDGFTMIDGGWFNRHYVQLAKQLAWCAATTAWTGGVTFAIMLVLDHIPGIGPFRASETAEILGVDETELGEFAYDYAYINRDLEGNCSPADLGHQHVLNIHEKNPGVVAASANGSSENATQAPEADKAQ